MENQSHPAIEKEQLELDVYIEPEILSHFLLDQKDYLFSNDPDHLHKIIKDGQRLLIKTKDQEYSLPYYKKNLLGYLHSLKNPIDSIAPIDFSSCLKSYHFVEKKLFAQDSVSQNNFRESWDEIIRKINIITNESHSLATLVSNILTVPFLHNFQSSLLVLHIKGQTQASIFGTVWREDFINDNLNVRNFNSFFNSIKKSKIKSFSTENFPQINLPFNGTFLAKEVTSQKYSLLALVSRHDFLSYSKNEIELFETCIDLMQPYFNRLVDQEFSNTQISELRLCLKEFPLPLRLTDHRSGASFNNSLFQPDLQEQDIIYSKNLNNDFKLDLYDSHELRHYAFDLFHFQRISLLGELLNTLRHELSNPLFGLKLGSQIFSSLNVSEDALEMMAEIEKNINRCQLIMENFSSLYQDQTESRPISVKKIIDEALILSKSEVREIQKSVNYLNDSEDVTLNVPLIFMVQIIFNLLINASQSIKNASIGRKGEIHLNISRQDRFLLIDVIDNGPGIDKEKVSQLFKPFFTTKPQGTGLGLVLSRNLAVKMGGNLEYCSSEESGAHFKLTIPIHETSINH
ncbi:MAG: HAMP domain-containing sensor histidine kinase [Candidatus Caldatribacteriota bacterium]